MTDQEMTLANDSLAKQMPTIVGEPLAQYAHESFLPIYTMGFAFGVGMSMSSIFLVLAWKGLISAWWSLPFFALAVHARKERTHRLVMKHGSKVALESGVRIVVHSTGYIELEKEEVEE
jgi:hypothetical protein